MKNDVQTLPQEFVDQLVTLYNQGKYLTLIERAQSLTIEYSEVFFIWNILGAALAQSRMIGKSIEAYKKCISLNPDYVDAYNNLGVALHNQNKFDEAVEQFKIALSMKPSYF